MVAVCVVMPVRDAAPTLDEAVESVLGQTLEDLELVAVDDGSTDGSPERLEHWAGRDGRIRVGRSPTPGIVSALNHGVRCARAPLVARMDADDVAEPERLALQVRAMRERPELGVLGTGASVLAETASPGLEAYHGWVASLTTPEDLERQCLVESPLVHSSVVARRELLVAHPYRDEKDACLHPGTGSHDHTTWPEDYHLWLRLLRAGVAMANLAEPLVRVRVHERRATVTGGFSTRAMARLKLDHLLRTRLSAGSTVVVQGAGRHGKMWARMLADASIRVRALLDVASKRQGKRIHGVCVHPVRELPGFQRDLLIVAVGQKGPNTRRDEVRAQLGPMGLSEGEDYVFVC